MLVFDVIHCSTSSCTDQPLQYMLTTLPRPQISSFTQHQLPRNAVPMHSNTLCSIALSEIRVYIHREKCILFAFQLMCIATQCISSLTVDYHTAVTLIDTRSLCCLVK